MWLTFSKNSQTFSVDLFQNYFGLERYMSGEPELKAIEALSEKPEALKKATKTSPYFGKWSIIWISLKYPLQATISSVCSTIAFALNTVWLKHYAAFFEVASKQMTRQWEQVVDQWSIQSTILIPALNAPKISVWDVYMCPSYLADSIHDPDILATAPKQAVFNEEADQALDQFYESLDQSRARQNSFRRLFRAVAALFSSRNMQRSSFKASFANDPQKAMNDLKKSYRWDLIEKPISTLYATLLSKRELANGFKYIQLYNSLGACRGNSEWFIQLFLKSSHLFTDSEKHLLAVAKQFETGVSGQGLLLQALVNCSRLLNQKVSQMHKQTVSTYELDADHASALKKIESLPTGIYRVGVFEHSLVRIVLPNGSKLTWDPSSGLYQQDSQAFLDFVLKYYYSKENPKSHIYFEKHESNQTYKKTG